MILVIGSGGNGQTYFMEFLEKNNVIINHYYDHDGLKHLYSPNQINASLEKQITKCIFLYNHPYISLLSHYRRGWTYTQINKLGNPFQLTESVTMSYEKYCKKVIKKQKDMFGIEYQFNNWINSNTRYPILFLHFNEVLKYKGLIDLFLEKPLNYNLFQYNERLCTIDNSDICKVYDNLYYTMQEKILKRSMHLAFKDNLSYNQNPI
jgi:hypothetical protein